MSQITSVRSWLLLGLLGLSPLAASCDDGDEGGGGGSGNASLVCQAGESRCQGTVIEICSGGGFVSDVDCGGAGQVCALDAAGQAVCAGSPCTDGASRCAGAALEHCTAGAWTVTEICTDTQRVCRTDPPSAEASCQALGWQQLPVEIDDPIMVGQSLMVPIDGISFGYDPGADAFITAFGRDFNDPSSTFLWHLDGATGAHSKKPIEGTTLPLSEGFCAGGEDWCQLIDRDPQSGEWVILGPSTGTVLRVTSGWVGSLMTVSGPQPADSFINHSHRFAWAARRLYLYGATGPSSFGDTVYAFDLDAASWTVLAAGLPQVDDNCLAYDDEGGVLFSLGGRLTTDGGNTTVTLDTYATIDATSGAHATEALPAAIGPRRSLSCAVDSGRRLLFVFAGAVVNDYWNEAENEYHNDLWVLDLVSGVWTELLPDTESGTLGPPDQYGDQQFTGHPDGPNFGQNRGYLKVDPAGDRLMIIGAVPIFTHEQIYFLRLTGIEQLL